MHTTPLLSSKLFALLDKEQSINSGKAGRTHARRHQQGICDRQTFIVTRRSWITESTDETHLDRGCLAFNVQIVAEVNQTTGAVRWNCEKKSHHVLLRVSLLL